MKDLAILSTGEKFKGPKPNKAFLGRLRLLNKSLSRKKKGSRNRGKARLKLARLHLKIANIRNDYLHKLTFYRDVNAAINIKNYPAGLAG